ncbi:MAG: hypothetical protein ACLVJO_03500 [[Clostridium] scindens]
MPVVELADAQDLKLAGLILPYRFDSVCGIMEVLQILVNRI